jgi:hypothetical protein
MRMNKKGSYFVSCSTLINQPRDEYKCEVEGCNEWALWEDVIESKSLKLIGTYCFFDHHHELADKGQSQEENPKEKVQFT